MDIQISVLDLVDILKTASNWAKIGWNYHLPWVAKGHLDELQKAEIVNTSKLVHSIIIKTHYWINHS